MQVRRGENKLSSDEHGAEFANGRRDSSDEILSIQEDIAGSCGLAESSDSEFDGNSKPGGHRKNLDALLGRHRAGMRMLAVKLQDPHASAQPASKDLSAWLGAGAPTTAFLQRKAKRAMDAPLEVKTLIDGTDGIAVSQSLDPGAKKERDERIGLLDFLNNDALQPEIGILDFLHESADEYVDVNQSITKKDLVSHLGVTQKGMSTMQNVLSDPTELLVKRKDLRDHLGPGAPKVAQKRSVKLKDPQDSRSYRGSEATDSLLTESKMSPNESLCYSLSDTNDTESSISHSRVHSDIDLFDGQEQASDISSIISSVFSKRRLRSIKLAPSLPSINEQAQTLQNPSDSHSRANEKGKNGKKNKLHHLIKCVMAVSKFGRPKTQPTAGLEAQYHMKNVSDRLNDPSDNESQKTIEEAEGISMRRKSLIVKCSGIDIPPSVIPKLDGSQFRTIFDLSELTLSVGVAVIDLLRDTSKSWRDIIHDQRDSTITLAQVDSQSSEAQESLIKEKKAWIDVDTLVEKLLCNEAFRNSLENDPFNHQQVHPHLFGIWNQSEFGEQFDLQLLKPKESLSVVSFESVLHEVSVNPADVAYLSSGTINTAYSDSSNRKVPDHPLSNALKATELVELERIIRKSRKISIGQQQMAALNHVLGKPLNAKKKLRHQSSFVQRASLCSIESYKKKQMKRDVEVHEEPMTEGQRQLAAVNQVLETLKLNPSALPGVASNTTARPSIALDASHGYQLFDFTKPQLITSASNIEVMIRDAVG